MIIMVRLQKESNKTYKMPGREAVSSQIAKLFIIFTIITILGIYIKRKIKLGTFVSFRFLRTHAIYTETNA